MPTSNGLFAVQFMPFIIVTSRVLGQAKDAERIKDFILKHSPHVLLVGATNMHCRQLHDDLNKVRDHILEHYPQFLTRSETGDVDITYGDETLAALWQTSAAAQAEMGDQPPLVRRAVCFHFVLPQRTLLQLTSQPQVLEVPAPRPGLLQY